METTNTNRVIEIIASCVPFLGLAIGVYNICKGGSILTVKTREPTEEETKTHDVGLAILTEDQQKQEGADLSKAKWQIGRGVAEVLWIPGLLAYGAIALYCAQKKEDKPITKIEDKAVVEKKIIDLKQFCEVLKTELGKLNNLKPDEERITNFKDAYSTIKEAIRLKLLEKNTAVGLPDNLIKSLISAIKPGFQDSRRCAQLSVIFNENLTKLLQDCDPNFVYDKNKHYDLLREMVYYADALVYDDIGYLVKTGQGLFWHDETKKRQLEEIKDLYKSTPEEKASIQNPLKALRVKFDTFLPDYLKYYSALSDYNISNIKVIFNNTNKSGGEKKQALKEYVLGIHNPNKNRTLHSDGFQEMQQANYDKLYNTLDNLLEFHQAIDKGANDTIDCHLQSSLSSLNDLVEKTLSSN